jgi:hypothetical protein
MDPMSGTAKTAASGGPFWMWVAEGDDAWLVADRLWPWLSTRRCDQITSVFYEDR